MEMCYDGELIMPSKCVCMDEEMMYCEGSGTVTIILTESFLKDLITAVFSFAGGIAGFFIAGGVSAGTAATMGALIGCYVGRFIGTVIASLAVQGDVEMKFNMSQIETKTIVI